MKRLIFSKEAKNALWIVAEQVFQMFLTFAISVLSARYLGPSNHGLINYTASFIAFVSTVVTLGMDGVVINKMINNPEKEGEFLGSSIIFRIISSIFCSITIIVIVGMLNPNNKLVLSLISLQSIQLVFKSIHILDVWFQKHLNSKYVSFAKMIACSVVSAYKIWLLITGKDCRWFAFSNSISSIVIAIVLMYFYKKQSNYPLSFSRKTGFNLLNESYHFILSGLMVSVYGQIDKMMLGGMVSSLSVGLYSVASGLCNMWLFVPLAIISSMRPKILNLKSQGKESSYLKNLKKLYFIIIWLCIGVSIFIFFGGKFAVNLLYGEAYIGAVKALKILIWSELFSMIGTARGIWILAENKNKYVKYCLGLGAIINVVLNYFLIPKFGIEGASFATLITQIFTSMIAPLLFENMRSHTLIVVESIIYRNGKKE